MEWLEQRVWIEESFRSTVASNTSPQHLWDSRGWKTVHEVVKGPVLT